MDLGTTIKESPFQKGKLISRSGELVTEFTMLPFQLMPEVAIWGTRVFCLDEPFKQTFGNPAEPIYREVCIWSVDASKMMEEMRDRSTSNDPETIEEHRESHPERAGGFSLGTIQEK